MAEFANPARNFLGSIDIMDRMEQLRQNRQTTAANQMKLDAVTKASSPETLIANKQAAEAYKALIAKPNKTAEDWTQIYMANPEAYQAISKAQEFESAEQKANLLDTAQNIRTALVRDPAMGIAMIEEHAEAYENSGRHAEANRMKGLAQLAAIDAQGVVDSLDIRIAALQGAEKFSETRGKMTDQDIKQELRDVEKSLKEEDLETKKLDRKIKVIDAKLKKTKDSREEEELLLKKEEFTLKRDQLDRERNIKRAEADTDYSVKALSMANIKEATDTLLDPKHRSAVRGAVGRIEGASWVPTVKQSTKNVEAIITNLKSNAFLEGIQAMRGMGALSNAEGEKVQEAIASLDQTQSEEAFLGQVKRIRERIQKLNEVYAKEYKIKFGTEPPTSIDWSSSSSRPLGGEMEEEEEKVISTRRGQASRKQYPRKEQVDTEIQRTRRPKPSASAPRPVEMDIESSLELF